MQSLDSMRLICVQLYTYRVCMFLHLRSFLVNIRDSCVRLYGLVSPWTDSGTCVQEDLLADGSSKAEKKAIERAGEKGREQP